MENPKILFPILSWSTWSFVYLDHLSPPIEQRYCSLQNPIKNLLPLANKYWRWDWGLSHCVEKDMRSLGPVCVGKASPLLSVSPAWLHIWIAWGILKKKYSSPTMYWRGSQNDGPGPGHPGAYLKCMFSGPSPDVPNLRLGVGPSTVWTGTPGWFWSRSGLWGSTHVVDIN